MASIMLVCFAIVALAAATQAVTGFGFALLAVPLLAVVVDGPTAVVGTSVVSFVPLTVTAVRDRTHVPWRTAALLLAWAVAGLPAGLLVLRGVPERWLTVVIAIVALACTLIVWHPPRFAVGTGMIAAVGVLTGVLTTSTGTNGPPLVAALRAMGYQPRAFRATIAAVFLGTGCFGVVGFLLTGAVTEQAGLLMLVGMPAAMLGWAAGDRIFSRLPVVAFRWLLLIALVGASALALLRAVLSSRWI